MNQHKRLQRAVDLKAWGWNPYQPDSLPFVGQTVEVVFADKKLGYATYDPAWENGFHRNNEALTHRPVMWRNCMGHMGSRDRTVEPEYMYG